MKNVIGGQVKPYRCKCIGCVGEWEYTNGNPGYTAILTDISLYCRSGQGTCDDDVNNPWP